MLPRFCGLMFPLLLALAGCEEGPRSQVRRPTTAADLADRVRAELRRGSGIRATSCIVGVSTWTAARIRDEQTAAA